MIFNPLLDLLTLALVLTPVETSLPVPLPAEAPPIVWSSLVRVACALELVGPHERWATNYSSEVDYCRRHWQQLWYAPGLEYAARYPSAAECHTRVRFCQARIEHLDCRRALLLHRADELTAEIEWMQRLLTICELQATATQPNGSWASRRGALLRLWERGY